MALVALADGAFYCFLSVNPGFKAAVDYDDFHANEWQSIIDCYMYFHRKLNGVMGFIKTCLFSRASFSSTEPMNEQHECICHKWT